MKRYEALLLAAFLLAICSGTVIALADNGAYGDGIYGDSTYGGVPAGERPGDLDGNRLVDMSDAAIVENSLGLVSGDAGFDSRADPNGDGIVNVYDLVFVGANFRNVY